MRNCTKLLALLLGVILISCKQETKIVSSKNEVKREQLDKKVYTSNRESDFKVVPVNFLEEKYKVNGYHLPDYHPTFPVYFFADEELGIFSVNYIGKSSLIQDYWSVYNKKGFFSEFKNIDRSSETSKEINDKVSQILKQKLNEYYIVASFLPKEAVSKYYNDGSGEFDLKDNACTYFYIYENNKWVFLKKLLTNKITKEGVDLYTELLLSYKLKNLKAIDQNYQGNFSATVEEELTTEGMGNSTYNFIINEDKISLKLDSFYGQSICEGDYKGTEENNVLELYYNGNDDRCIKLDPTYLIKKEGNKYFIKGVGGEGTFHEWIKLDKK
ncbi:hypothetical protein B0A80_02385 [Flavobacterium tructae]|uniref:hypothetical protein n=1 Tax=Flavobacterium tructae TaxID=1114873 RepID=UPI000B5B7F80|nr:hypothetical protein [Flavobacterium tructae]OXB25098.1 hypothetical protein B0A80_02385 [Flavobacterium tructae]